MRPAKFIFLGACILLGFGVVGRAECLVLIDSVLAVPSLLSLVFYGGEISRGPTLPTRRGFEVIPTDRERRLYEAEEAIEGAEVIGGPTDDEIDDMIDAESAR